MADTGLPGLTAAAVLDGTELLYITQGGNSRKTTVAAVGGALPLVPSGAAGSGSFTPTTAAKGAPAMSQLRVGGCFLFRFDDGGAWEARWGFWTGAAITRPTNGFVASSTGSALSLTAAAIATVMSPIGLFQRGMGEFVALCTAIPNSTVNSVIGMAISTDGTAGVSPVADTNLLSRQTQLQLASATTANAAGGFRVSNALGNPNAGYHFSARFGSTQNPSAPRLAVGMAASLSALAGEPSALVNVAMFAKDSTDTNIQFMVNNASGVATKTDTSILFAINTLLEANLWCDPGGATQYGLLVDYTNQAVWYGSASSKVPVAATLAGPRCGGALNGTDTGTAMNFRFCNMSLRTGA